MAKIKLSAEDKHIQEVEKFDWCAYVKVNGTERTVGVFNTTNHMLGANRNKSLKALRNKFSFTIQMVIE